MSSEIHEFEVEPTRSRPAGPATSWRHQISPTGWRALLAAAMGWTFEVFDVALLALTIPAFLADFHVSKAEIGIVGTIQAAGMIVGGIVGGGVADRIGRVRTLSYAIGWYAVCTGITAAAGSLTWVEILRFLAGLGMGACWTAGAALVAETWPTAHRGKGGALMQSGMPLGNLLALAAAAVVAHGHSGLDEGRWRMLYLVGALPLLFAVYVRLATPESPLWLARDTGPRTRSSIRSLGAPALRRPLLTALAFVFFIQYLFYAVNTFLPTFLVEVDHMAFAKSLTYLVALQFGAIAGFAAFAVLVDHIGRRPTFVGYLLIGACAIGLLLTVRREGVVLAATFLAGVGISGVFAGVGPWTAEMMHRAPARGLAMGVIYNGGRTGGAIAPYAVGALAVDTAAGFRLGLGTAIAAAALAVVMMLLAPETRGRELTT
ncbi:MFS transporter [Streptomyces sp. TM32]|uniref:MFS transporter n=1 Tax=Streptomyces sp. TM32 TaxID=1652669 RepID=UPI001012C214|nr:MFS transporter [Streptomyces sp. TM32]RXS88396.1 MFS transporter [Streptomyces sp. TM32]